MSRRLTAVALGALALCGASAQGALAEEFQIEAVGSKRSLGKVTAIGDFHPRSDPTLQAATGVFGQPTKIVPTSDVSCRVLYAAVGLRFSFVNLGGGAGCDPALTKSQVARAYDARWHTGKGLQIFDRLGKLRRLYPGATRHGRSWWLVRGRNIYGVGQRPYPVLRATMNGRRVNSFALQIGAAGE